MTSADGVASPQRTEGMDTLTVTPPVSEHVCLEPGCDKTFASAQGLNMHVTRSHRSAEVEASELFERIGRATEILFPQLPYSRIIEIADWQKATLRLLTRS